jgi:hypothetical protein
LGWWVRFIGLPFGAATRYHERRLTEGWMRTEILIAWPKSFCYDSAALESYGIIH